MSDITDLIEADVTDVFINTADFAESVTREIKGVAAHTEVHNALVDPDAVSIDRTNGKAVTYHYQLLVAATITPTEADSYLIRGERCRVLRVGKPQHNLIPVWLQRVEGVTTEARRTRSIR